MFIFACSFKLEPILAWKPKGKSLKQLVISHHNHN